MSKSIESRIVEMQFDNKNFEKNAAQSMSTLDKLKEKLDFSGSSKALSELENSSKNLNLSSLSKAFGAVKEGFSALEQVGIGALRRIGDQAVQTGEKLIKSLTTENISAGFEKFGEETKAVSTLKAQGYELEQIEKQVELLNWFTDETSYNFTSMIQEIGKFTASGQSLENSVTAMMGIANWAALSGQNAAKASSAMYQLSQAMSKGALRYDDWKSIQNASMDTIEFRQQAAESAISLGMMRKEADELGNTVYRLARETESGTQKWDDYTVTLNELFTSDYLTREEWLDTDVMMKVFTDYGKASKTLKAIVDDEENSIDLASEAMDMLEKKAESYIKEMASLGETVSKNDALQKVSLDVIKGFKSVEEEANSYIISVKESEGRTIDINTALTELGYGLDELSLKAILAAQQARTWEDTLDAVKDAVSSGWSKTFKNIFGNQEEAVSLWTRLANDLYDIFASTGEARNNMLSVWKEMNGRDLLLSTDEENLGSIFRLLEAIKTILGVINQAKNEIFYGTSDEEAAAQKKAEVLYNIVQSISNAINNVTESLRSLDSETENENSTVSKLRNTFKGLFAIVDILKTIFSEAFSASLEIINSLFGKTNTGVLDITSSIGSAIVAFRDWDKESGFFKNIFGGISSVIVNAIKWIKDLVSWVKTIPVVANTISFVKENFDSLKNSISEFYNGIKGKSISEIMSSILNEAQSFKIVRDLKSLIKTIWDSISNFWNILTGTAKEFSSINSFLVNFFVSVGNTINGFITKLGLTAIDFSAIVDSITNTLKNLSLNDVVIIGIGVAIFLFIRKLLKSVSKVGTIVDSFNDLTKSIGGLITGIKNNLKSNALLMMTASILILVAALSSLAMLDPDRMWGAVAVLSIISGLMIALLATTNFMGNLAPAAMSISALAVALALLAGAMYTISKVNLKNADKAVVLLGFISTWMAVIGILCAKIIKGNDIFKRLLGVAALFIGISLAMRILVGAIKKLAEMDVSDLDKIGSILFQILTPLSLVVVAASFVKKGAGAAILAASVSLYLIIGAIKRINSLDPVTALRGLYFVKEIFTMFATTMALISASSMFSKTGNGMKGVAASILAISVSLWSIIGIVSLLGLIPSDSLQKGLTAVYGLMLVIGAVVALSRFSGENASKAGSMLFKMAMALSMLSVVIAALSVLAYFNPDGFTQALVAVSVLMSIMTAMVALSVFAKDAAKGLSALSIPIIALSAAVALLALIDPDGKKVHVISASLSMLFGVLGLVIYSTKFVQQATGTMLTLAGIMVALSAIMIVLSQIPVKNALLNSIGLSVLMAALSGSIVLLTKFAQTIPFAEMAKLSGFVGMLSVVTGLLAFVLYNMNKLDPVKAILNSSALLILLGALTGVTILLSKFATFGPEIATFAIISVIVGVLAFIIYNMNKLDPVNAILNATALTILLTGVSLMLLAAIPIGTFAAAASSALVVFVEFLVILAGVLSYAGLIMSVPGFAEIMENGVEFLRVIGEAIGAFFGGIISGFKNATAKGEIEKIGQGMASFYETVSNIDDPEKLTKMIEIANMFGDLGVNVANISGITNLSSVFEQLTDFGPNIVELAKSFNDVDIDPSKVDAVTNVGKMLAGLAKELPPHDGILQSWIGDNSLAAFARDMVGYAANLKPFCDYVKDIDMDADKVNAVVNTGVAFSSLANNLPNHDGILQSWIGDNSLAAFARDMVGYAANFKSFCDCLNGIDVDANDVDVAVNAGKMFSGLANTLPAHDGILQTWIGDNSLASFARDMVGYVANLKPLCENLSELKINDKQVESAYNLGFMMTALANSLPETGSIFEIFTGRKQTLTEFGEDVTNLGSGIKGFSDALTENGGIDADAMDVATRALDVLTVLENNLPETGNIFSWITGGDKDLDGFINDMPKLAEGVRAFSDAVTKEGGIDSTAVSAAAETLNALASMSNIIGLPDFGPITGQLIPMAENLRDYSNILESSKFKAESINEVTSAVTYLVDLEKGIKINSFDKTEMAFTQIGGIVTLLSKVSNLDTDKIEAFSSIISGFGKDGISDFLEAMTSNSSSIEQGALTILNSFINGVESKENAFYESFAHIADVGISAIRSKASEFSALGTEISDDFITGVNNGVNDEETGLSSVFSGLDIKGLLSGGNGTDLIGNITGLFSSTSSVSSLNTSGNNIMSDISSGMMDFDLSDTGDNIIGNIQNLFSGDSSADIKKIGTDIMGSVSTGIDTAVPDFKIELGEISKDGAASMKTTDVINEYSEAGENAISGFVNGANGKIGDVNSLGNDIGGALLNAIKTKLNIKSPSKEMYNIGEFAGEGFINALSEYTKLSYESGIDISESAMEGMKYAIGNAVLTMDDVQATPTIKPVVDLTDVDLKTKMINDIFGINASPTIANNINAMMGDYSNEINVKVDNQDVVDEIASLRSEIGVMADKLSKLQVVLDTGAMVGSLTGPMDTSLGSRAIRRKR